MALEKEGLVVDRFPEVLEKIEDLEKVYIHPDIETSDDEFLGQLNNVLADRQASILELVEAVNDNFNIDTAEDKYLDDLGTLKNTPRLGSTETQGAQYFTGDFGTIINSGMLVENSSTGDRYETRTIYTISEDAVISCDISILNIENSSDYTVIAGGTTYTFTSDSDATTSEILNGIKALIDADGSAKVTATVNGSLLVLDSVNTNSFSIVISNNLSFFKGTISAYVYAIEVGPTVAALGEVDTIATPLLTLDSTTNPTSFLVGSYRETDEVYRLRLKTSSTISGKSTLSTMTAALRGTVGVGYASVEENDTMAVDGSGRPAKSFEAIVQGGLDADVAQTIYDYKPLGIASYGNTSQGVTNEYGQSFTINFSRATGIVIAVRVTYSLYSEETEVSNRDDLIRQAVVDHINSLDIGEDVITGRMFSVVYGASGGIGEVTVEIQTLASSGDAPNGGSWSTNTIAIDVDGFAQNSLVDITIVEV